MKTETEWAIRNLELAGLFDKDSDYGGMIGDAVKKLLELHSSEGHSGASHSLCVELFYRTAKGQALTQKYWDERFKNYNEFAKQNGGREWTEEEFERLVTPKPKNKGGE